MAHSSRLENLNTLRVANLDAAFASAFATLYSGALIVGLIQHLKGNEFWLGIVAALPAFLGLLQLPGAAWARSIPSFRSFSGTGGLIWRLAHFPLIALPLLPVANEAKLIILVACVSAGAAAGQIVGPCYNEWLGRLIPENARGWYFSQRTLIASITGNLVGMAGGLILDLFRRLDQEALGFTLIFTLGAACAVLSMVFFWRMSDTVREETSKFDLRSIFDTVRTPMRDRNFRRILLFVSLFAASQGFAGNLFAAFARESLDMPFALIQSLSIAAMIGTILTVKMWGFLGDRYGNKPTLLLLVGGVSLTPVLWLVCQPGQMALNASILLPGHVFNGIVWSGVGVVQMNLYLATSKPADRANYLAAALTVQALAMAASPLLGAAMLNALRPLMETELAYKWVFVAVIAWRIAALLALLPVRERGASNVTETVTGMLQASPKGVAALRTIRAGADPQAREVAIKNVGETQLTMATSELVDALVDPTPRVRRRAAESLGRMGTVDAGHALVRHMQEHPFLVEEETLLALAGSPVPEAVPLLTRYLDDPSAQLRRAAARALGAVGDPAAVEALRGAAHRPGDPDLRRASIQALRSVEARDPELYRDGLLEQHVSVRVAAAEAASELQIKELADTLRQSLEWYQDEGSSEAAYALGQIGEKSDLPLVLKVAQQAVGDAKRQRALLGAAALLGVEIETYRSFTRDEVARDSALLTLVRPLIRRDPALREACDLFAAGEEAAGLTKLALRGDPYLITLAEASVPGSFWVALPVYVANLKSEGEA